MDDNFIFGVMKTMMMMMIQQQQQQKLSTWNIEGDHRKLYYETIPKTKPDFILAWEAKYGNKEE